VVRGQSWPPWSRIFSRKAGSILGRQRANWFIYVQAVDSANGRKGSTPLPIVVVGTKVDDVKVSLYPLAPSSPFGHYLLCARSFSFSLYNIILTDPGSFLDCAARRAETSSPRRSSSRARRTSRTLRSPRRQTTTSRLCCSRLSRLFSGTSLAFFLPSRAGWSLSSGCRYRPAPLRDRD
jgi:hypothetical protein